LIEKRVVQNLCEKYGNNFQKNIQKNYNLANII
jgi:ribosomal protein S17E